MKELEGPKWSVTRLEPALGGGGTEGGFRSPYWGRAATGQKKKKKILCLCTRGLFQSHPILCEPVDCGLLCQASLPEGFSRQEYWSVLANTGCHPLLEHYISYCPRGQLPWAPGAARTPATQAAAPPPHLALTGANLSPPGKPQEQTPVDYPYPEVGIKPQLKHRGSVTKEDPKPSHQLYHCRLNPHDQLGRLCIYRIYKSTLRAPTKDNAVVLIAVDIGGKNTQM